MRQGWRRAGVVDWVAVRMGLPVAAGGGPVPLAPPSSPNIPCVLLTPADLSPATRLPSRTARPAALRLAVPALLPSPLLANTHHKENN